MLYLARSVIHIHACITQYNKHKIRHVSISSLNDQLHVDSFTQFLWLRKEKEWLVKYTHRFFSGFPPFITSSRKHASRSTFINTTSNNFKIETQKHINGGVFLINKLSKVCIWRSRTKETASQPIMYMLH